MEIHLLEIHLFGFSCFPQENNLKSISHCPSFVEVVIKSYSFVGVPELDSLSQHSDFIFGLKFYWNLL